MPAERLSFRELTRGLWLKGPKENCPGGYLRRAKSIFPPRGGSIMSRSGCVTLCAQNAHSLFKFNQQRILGVATSLLRFDGGPFPAIPTAISMPAGVTLDGSRLNFMEIPAQFLATNPNIDQDTKLPGAFAETDFLFCSSVTGGFVPFKVDVAFGASKWGIGPPTKAMLPDTVTLLPQGVKDIDNLQVANWTQRGGIAPLIVSARSATGAGSLRVRNDKDSATSGEAIIVKAISINLNFVDVPNTIASSDEDYIGVWVHLNKPAHVQKLTLKVFTGPGPFVATDFLDPNTDPPPESPYKDFYVFECPIKVVNRQEVKTLRGLGDNLPNDPKKQAAFLKKHPASTGIDLTQQQFTSEGQLEVTNNTWTHLLVPKNQFKKAGRAGQPTFTWASVIGVELSIENNSSGKGAVWWDHLQLIGGAGMKGDYLYTLTFRNDNTGSRSNPPMDTTGNATTNTNFGQVQTVAANMVDRNAVRLLFVTLTTTAINAIDPQITHVELWRNIGNGGVSAFFKVPIFDQFGNQLPGIPKSRFSGVYIQDDSAADYIGMFTGGGGGNNILNPEELLAFDNSPPVAALGQAVYHPPSGRVFALDYTLSVAPAVPGIRTNANRVIYSPPGRPESLGNGGFIEPTTPDDPIQRLVIWGDRLWVLSRARLFLVEGQDEPFVALEAIGVPGTTQPLTVQATPLGIMYQARDGVRVFNGSTSELVADDVLSQIFRGSTAETIPPFTGVVSSYGRDEYVISDTVSTTLALNIRDSSWRNVGFETQAIYHEKDTSICLATAPIVAFTGVLVLSHFSTTLPTPTNPFMPLASFPGLPQTTANAAQGRMPISVTFTAMYVVLSSALGGNGTMTVKFNVNGVTQSVLNVTISAGDTTSNTTGMLSVAQDDLICLETVWTGTTAAATIKGITIAYTVTS